MEILNPDSGVNEFTHKTVGNIHEMWAGYHSDVRSLSVSNLNLGVQPGFGAVSDAATSPLSRQSLHLNMDNHNSYTEVTKSAPRDENASANELRALITRRPRRDGCGWTERQTECDG
ncbi:hypothetical protein VZT92_017857 [Zoarces viviparus]|uniref:Uncharacterized protein n=1 Tax=Zoarces viviparus TaxID=48416 RepID=A0AAW1EMN4_ZOAVI